MEIIKENKMKDGTPIYLEDWSKDYPNRHTRNNVITAYPIAERSSGGSFGVRGGEPFMLMFTFENEEQTQQAFAALLNSTKSELKSFESCVYDRKRLNYI